MNFEKTKLSFVIADDDRDDQELLLDAFVENGVSFESVSVYNGRELMDYLLFRKPYEAPRDNVLDFIFLDMNMPMQNGLDVLREMQASEELSKIPVYVFSTHCSADEEAVAIGLGATRCFVKPSEFRVMKKMVTEIVALN